MAHVILIRFFVGHSVQDSDGNTVKEHEPEHVERVASEVLGTFGFQGMTATAARGVWQGVAERSTIVEHVDTSEEAAAMARNLDGPAGHTLRPHAIKAARAIGERLGQSEVLVTFSVVDVCTARPLKPGFSRTVRKVDA